MNRLTLKFGVLLVIILTLVGGIRPFTPSLAQSATPAATSTSQDVTFPDLTGPYKVGRSSYEWIDQSRNETFASAPGLKRDLMVTIWYPASPTKRTKIAPYMDGGDLVWDSYWKVRNYGKYLGLGLESSVHSHAFSTSQLDTDKPNYPVLIFVPGLTSTSFVYASLIEDIASHGYIVIGTTQPYTTAAISYPDGRLVVAGSVGQATTDNLALLALFSKDVQFVLDQAEKLNATVDSFKGHLDLSRIGIFGQSFGGETAIEVTATDPRVKAGVALDPGDLRDSDTADVGSKPFLFVARAVRGQQPQDKYALTIIGMSHENYSDTGLLVPLMPVLNNVIGTVDPARGLQIVNAYVLAFFDHYLKGTALNWPTYDEAHLAPLASAATAVNTSTN